jgi:hypothetical protein
MTEHRIPSAGEFSEVYDKMLMLAEEHVRHPQSAEIDAWEDGTFRIKIFHKHGTSEEDSLYYHSEEGVIKYAIEDLDAGELVTEREITTLDSSSE